jgi:transposase-like protein
MMLDRIRQAVSGSRVYTDSLNIYRELQAMGSQHATVDHSRHFITSRAVHIQGIESHWAHTKWPMTARYRKISHKHLPKYLAAADFTVSTRQPSSRRPNAAPPPCCAAPASTICGTRRWTPERL